MKTIHRKLVDYLNSVVLSKISEFSKCERYKLNMLFVCVCVCADRVQRQEREVMLKLKEVVDRQRDELRAKVQEITTISKEVEAVRRHA